MKRPRRKRLYRCSETNLVILWDELEAKIILAQRQHRDKGEIRYFACKGHYHLTSMPLEDN